LGLPDVTVVEDHVSVYAKGVALGHVLEVIEREAGIQFEANKHMLEKKIFVDFKQIALLKAVRKILAGLDYAIIYDPSGKARKVVIFGESNASRVAGDASVYVGAHSKYETGQPEGSKSSAESAKAHNEGFERTPIQGPPGAGPKPLEPPPGSDIKVIKGPSGVDPRSLEPPPGSELIVPKGPPEAGSISLDPPPGSDITVTKAPHGLDPESFEPPPGSEMTGMEDSPGMNTPDLQAPPAPPVFPRTDD
jgi:hypothetical protein